MDKKIDETLIMNRMALPLICCLPEEIQKKLKVKPKKPEWVEWKKGKK